MSSVDGSVVSIGRATVRDVAQVSFAKAVRRHVDCPDAQVGGATLRDVFAGYFATHPDVERYVLDEQGRVRKHVTVFVNEEQITDRVALTDPVGDDDRIMVFQALSGGA